MLSDKVIKKMGQSSWIRAMFEEGERLRREYGNDKVFDFSLGNPDLEPPKATIEALKNLVNSDQPNLHKYMSNAGYPNVRASIANHIQHQTGVQLTENHIVMTCGAAGGLNVVFKTILNPNDEVVVFSPYFPEYLSYVDNFNGKVVISPCSLGTFEPSLEDLELRITPATKAILLNSPNNPTGVVYSKTTLKGIAELIKIKEKQFSTKILVISDEPYTQLVYDGESVPSILQIFSNSVVVNSYSKCLALPGERIGYIAVNPATADADLLINGLAYSNRTLGFVNAPALFQKVVAESLNAIVDTNIYKQRRDFLYHHLTRLGFSCILPKGAFYFFPKTLIDDDIEFVNRAQKYNLLLVPGTGFGCPGYFRISYSVSMEIIENSIPAFEALVSEFL
jgi:aspartate aminotransferase